ncbi:MAG: hypothetical protein Q4C58_01585 [Eubacteriales bacterium]|nr:hypothetical protein [Eubacteriales bacterium]
MNGENVMKMSAGGSDPKQEQERELIRKKRIMNICVFIIFIIVSMIYYSIAGGSQVVLSVQETSLLIEVPKKSAYEVEYAEIRSMTLRDAPECGDVVEGGTAGKCNYGLWQNEQWGTYECYILTNVDNCIVLETDRGIVAFNFESEEATESFYEAFQEKIGMLQAD